MKLLVLIIGVSIVLSSQDIHHRHTHVTGASIGPAMLRVHNDVALKSPPGSIEHETQYWHETNEVKRNSPDAYYDGGENGATSLPSYSVAYGLGG